MDNEERLNKITETIIVEILKEGIQRIVNNFPDSLRTRRALR